MKRWSLDARSRRRRPQALCVGVKEEFAEILNKGTVDKSSTHRENPASSD